MTSAKRNYELAILFHALVKGLDDVEKLQDEIGGVAEEATNAAPAADRLNQEINELSDPKKAQGLQGLSAALGRFKGAVAVVAAALAAGLSGKALLDDASALESQMGKLRAIIETTGGAAGLTAEQIDKLARDLDEASLGSASGFRDAAAALLTFKSINEDTNQAFSRTLGLAQDMAEVFGGDVTSATVQLAKALEDPVNGLSALSRVGVTFSEQQQEMIKGFVEMGQAAKAQTEILNVLQGQLGGAGAGAGSGLDGAVDLVNKRLTDIKETLGAALLPIVTDATNIFAEFLKSLQDNGIIDGLANAIRKTAAIFGALSASIVTANDLFALFGKSLLTLDFSETFGKAEKITADYVKRLAELKKQFDGNVTAAEAVAKKVEKTADTLNALTKYTSEGERALSAFGRKLLEITDIPAIQPLQTLAQRFDELGVKSQTALDATAKDFKELLQNAIAAKASVGDIRAAYEAYAKAATDAAEHRGEAAVKATQAELDQLAVSLKLKNTAQEELDRVLALAKAIDEKNAKLKESAEAEKEAADTAERSAEQQAEAADQAGEAAQRVVGYIGAVAEGYERLSEAGRQAFNDLAKSLQGIVTQSTAASLEARTVALRRIVDAEEQWSARILETVADLKNASSASEENRLRLQLMGQAGRNMGEAMTQAGLQAQQALADIRGEAESAANALQTIIDQLREAELRRNGDQTAIADLEYQRKLAEITRLEELSGNRAIAEEARRLAEREHKARLKEIQERAKAEQEANRQNSATNSNAQGGNQSGESRQGRVTQSASGPTTINNTFNIDPTKLASEEWVRKNVIPTLDKVARLRG